MGMGVETAARTEVEEATMLSFETVVDMDICPERMDEAAPRQPRIETAVEF